MFSSNKNSIKGKCISEDVRKSECLKIRKNKTTKEKYFVLRAESSMGPARLEYYANEKKYRNGHMCKCSIILKDCFSVNKKRCGKDEYLIGLYTKDDCLTLVLQNQEQFDEWLQTILELKNGYQSGHIKPYYECVWQVSIHKGKNDRESLPPGTYRLCLTGDKKIHLVKVNSSEVTSRLVEFPLSCMRKLGHNKKFLYIELGRDSPIGAGELWMMADDDAASDMHSAIVKKINRSITESEPVLRPRSASTSEGSGPNISKGIMRENSFQNSQIIPVTYSISQAHHTITNYGLNCTTISVRDRCDSLPSNYRKTKEMPPGSLYSNSEALKNCNTNGWNSSSSSTNPFSPSACSTDSIGSSLSEDFDHSLALNSTDYYEANHLTRESSAIPSEPPIREEDSNSDDYLIMNFAQNKNASLSKTSNLPASISRQQELRSSLNLKLKSFHSSSPVASPQEKFIENDYVTMSPLEINGKVEKNSNRSTPMSNTNSDDDYLPMLPLSAQSSTDAVFKNRVTNPSNGMSLSRNSSTTPHSLLNPARITTPTTSSTHNLNPKEFSAKINGCEDDYLDPVNMNNSIIKMDPQNITSSAKISQKNVKSKVNEEYRLDKIKSYVLPGESETSSDYTKPVRAYSMGSRPPPHREGHLLHLPLRCSMDKHLSHNTTKPEIRVRSFSIGSTNVRAKRNGTNDRDELSLLRLENKK